MLDVLVDLPVGWTQQLNTTGSLTYSPDGGESVLQLSSWLVPPGRTLEARVPDVVDIVTCEDLGSVTRTEQLTLGYGPAIRAYAGNERRAVAIATLFVPEVHEPMFATYVADHNDHVAAAQRIVDEIRPGALASAMAAAIQGVRASLVEHGDVSTYALLICGNSVTPVGLTSVPSEIWFDACRAERARLGAEVVVVIMSKPREGDTPQVAVYGESPQRHRAIMVEGPGVRDVECRRRDLFRDADPRTVAALARRPVR